MRKWLHESTSHLGLRLSANSHNFSFPGSEQTQFQVPVSAGVIAGGVVAAVTALLLCIGGATVAFVYWRRKQHATSNDILRYDNSYPGSPTNHTEQQPVL